jgi:hypothetical protein
MVIIDERSASVRSDIGKESKNRFESIEYIRSCLENDFPKL